MATLCDCANLGDDAAATEEIYIVGTSPITRFDPAEMRVRSFLSILLFRYANIIMRGKGFFVFLCLFRPINWNTVFRNVPRRVDGCLKLL